MKKIMLLAALAHALSAPVVAYSGAAPVVEESAASMHGDMSTMAGAVPPPGHASAFPADIQLANSGKVLQVLDGGTYSYVQVTSERGPLWLAAYKTQLQKGATVNYSNGIAMPRFRSKSLDRTFDLIVFVDRLEPAK